MLWELLSRIPKTSVEEIRFDSGPLPVAMATKILEDDPERRRTVAALRNLLSAIPKSGKESLVDRVIQRFVLLAVDLAASERNHHARPFGLLNHSLEVARLALERAQDRRFESSPDPVVNHERQPRWVYAVFVSALLHDVGKVADVTVTAPDGSAWNPFVEPLAAFYRRHGLVPGDPERIRYRRDRGLEGHVLHNPYFFSMVLPVEAREYLGRIQSDVLVGESEATATLKALVGQADKLSASRDSADLPGAARRDAADVRDGSLWPCFVDGFTRAIEEGLLVRDRLDGHVFIGDRHVALTYPTGTVLAIQRFRRSWDLRAPELQVYTADEAGARKLLHQFAQHGWVFVDRETGAWSFDAALRGADESRSTVVVLFPKGRLLPDTPAGSFSLALTNRETHREVALGDFQARVSPRPAAPASAPTPRATLPTSAEDLGVDAVAILSDLRNSLRTGNLSVNIRRADVYLTPTHAHVVLPSALDRLALSRGYKVVPSEALNPYLNLLGRNPLIEHRPGGEVLFDVFTSHDALKPIHTLRIKLAGWLSKDELDRYGSWNEPFVEATPAEKERREAARRSA